MNIKNETVLKHNWLKDMYQDGYFPDFLVDKIKNILLQVAETIETNSPSVLTPLYTITNKGVEKINELQDEFWDNESEIETVARDAIGEDFMFLANAYGFEQADNEDLISERDW